MGTPSISGRYTPWILAAAGIALTVGAGVAFAQGVTPANAPLKEWIDTNNAANKLLCSTIGDVGGTGLFGCSGGGSAALTQVFKVFNLAVFSIAALFVFWNIISATMSGAAEGEFLGKRNHSTWGPIRMVIGAAMLIPAFGGFNLAQLIMVWATAVGVGIAGAGASTAITELEMGSRIYSVPATLLRGSDVATLSREPAQCVGRWVAATKLQKDEGSTDTDATSMLWTVTPVMLAGIDGAPVLRLQYGAMPATGGYDPSTCGTIEIILPNASRETDQQIKAIINVAAAAESAAAQVLAQVIMGEMVKRGRGDIKTPGLEASDARIIAAIAAYDSSVNAAAQGAVDAANATTSKLTVGQGNWVALGFGDVRTAVAGVALAKGGASKTAVSAARVNASEAPPCASAEDQANGTFCASGSNQGPVVNVAADTIASAVMGAASVMNFTKRFDQELNVKVGELGAAVAGQLQQAAAAGGGSPLAGLIQLGVKLSSWMASVMMWFLAATLVLVGVSYVVPGVGGFITIMGFLLLTFAIPLMFFGIKLAAYLPFLMAIIWSGAILNWLVIVVEALFGAPLWALAHLDLEGDGINFQRTGHGYIFLLNLLFRPIMMVGSLIFAKLAMSAIFGLFLGSVTGMLTNLTNTSGDWWGNLLMIIGAVWVTVVFAEQIVSQCMSLIFQIPDKVFAWIGGQFGSSVGADIGGGVGQQVSGLNSAGAGAAGATGKAGLQAAGAASTYMGGLRTSGSSSSGGGSLSPAYGGGVPGDSGPGGNRPAVPGGFKPRSGSGSAAKKRVRT